MTIRPYLPDDHGTILELLRLNTPKYFDESEEAGLVDYLGNYAQNHFVVEDDGVIIGCGGYNISPDGSNGVLSWDIFHPAAQGKGTGSALAKFRIERMKQAGVPNIGVRTSQHACKFYEKMGFTLKEVVEDYWAPGFDLYDMEIALK